MIVAGDLSIPSIPSPQSIGNAGASKMIDPMLSGVSDAIDRSADKFMGVSKELGLGAAVAFAFMALGAIGWGIQHYTITVPESKQALEDRKAENETKRTVAKGFEVLTVVVAGQAADIKEIKTDVGALTAKVEQTHEDRASQWRFLGELRDDVRMYLGKAPSRVGLPGASVTASAKPERPEAPPMPTGDTKDQ